MGACMSSNVEDTEQRKRSQMIDKKLEEDSKRLRRECKILLLGEYLKFISRSRGQRQNLFIANIHRNRFGREW